MNVPGKIRFIRNVGALLISGCALPAMSESDAELARKTQNPIAAMISLPLQLNYDKNIGPVRDGNKTVLNVQPVIPFSISKDWNLISRTIVPLIDQHDVVPGAGDQSGFGDITQSFFFSPKEPSASGWIWGAGPVLLLRTGSSDLTAHKWGLGPTAVVLKQDKGWTYGMLANHISSAGGSDQAPDISATLLQPFLSYTNKSFTTYGISSESVYNWKSNEWSVPLNLTASQLLKIHGQPVTLLAGVRYWADSPNGIGPTGWGFRLAVTFLFPR